MDEKEDQLLSDLGKQPKMSQAFLFSYTRRLYQLKAYISPSLTHSLLYR